MLFGAVDLCVCVRCGYPIVAATFLSQLSCCCGFPAAASSALQERDRRVE
jgi:hypothetical protein